MPNHNTEAYTQAHGTGHKSAAPVVMRGVLHTCLGTPWHPENRLGTQERNATDTDIPINHLVTIRYIFLINTAVILSIVSSHD